MWFLFCSQADQKKEEGNQLYKTRNYREALQKYSEAIELCPQTAAFYGNRSACHMMLSQFTQALADAKNAVQLDAEFVKGKYTFFSEIIYGHTSPNCTAGLLMLTCQHHLEFGFKQSLL